MEEERCQDVCGYIRSLIARGELHLGDRLPNRARPVPSLGRQPRHGARRPAPAGKHGRIGEPPGLWQLSIQ